MDSFLSHEDTKNIASSSQSGSSGSISPHSQTQHESMSVGYNSDIENRNNQNGDFSLSQQSVGHGLSQMSNQNYFEHLDNELHDKTKDAFT